jgi:outer membrane protein
MKKIVTVVLVAAGLMVAGNRAQAQTKIGYISLQELIQAMPEAKKADSALAEFSSALNQSFEDQKKEFQEQDSLLSSKDTARFTKAQLELKRKGLVEMYQKLNGYQQQASQLYQQKREELIAPIQKKAVDATQTVAKEAGYGYVFVKDAMLVSPPADDLLPLVKKKLGVK